MGLLYKQNMKMGTLNNLAIKKIFRNISLIIKDYCSQI